MCLKAEIEEYLDILARGLGLRSVEDLKILGDVLSSESIVWSRVPSRFKRSPLLRRVSGGYRLTELGALLLEIITSKGLILDSLYEGVSVKSVCSRDLLAASLIITAATLNLRRLQEAYGDILLRTLAGKSLQAIGLSAMIYILASTLSGDEAYKIVARIAGLLDLNPMVVEECKNILWKAITRSKEDEEAELMELLGKAIAKVNKDMMSMLTETLGDIVDYACIIAREEGREIECNKLEEAVEKLLETLRRYLRKA